jgi:uncharacterized cupin superfamily protein
MPVITTDRAPQETEGIPGVYGPVRTIFLSEGGGLTQFGAYLQIVPPGSRTSAPHWHSAEDEMVYLVSGEAVVIEDGRETPMRPGDAATFKAGEPRAHCIENRGSADAHIVVIGTRAGIDAVTYPTGDLVCHHDRSKGTQSWTNLAGVSVPRP